MGSPNQGRERLYREMAIELDGIPASEANDKVFTKAVVKKLFYS